MNLRKLPFVFLSANLMIFISSGCITSEEKIKQKLELLKNADDQHKQMLSKELDAEPANEQRQT